MIVKIDTHGGIPIFRQIYDQISRQIVTGQLRTGEQLPTIREFAVELKINPMTLSKAYSLLESDGYLDRRRGLGLFVKELSSGKASRMRNSLAENILEEAALKMTQIGIEEKEALKIFSRHLHSAKKEE